MSTFNWRNGVIVSATLLAIALFVGLLVGTSASSGKAGNTDTGVDLPEEDQAALTVQPGDLHLLDERARCKTSAATFEWRSKDRKWSDAVSTPFKSSDKSDMLSEILAENCTNSVTLDMNVQALSEMEIAGFSVAKANPWLTDFLAEVDNKGLNKATLQYKDASDKTIVLTASAQEVAMMTNHLILQFKADDIRKEKSVKNWHLPSLVAGEVPRTKLNSKQEGLKVFSVEYTMKGQPCVFRWGWNTGDKRAEFLSCETPAKPPTVKKTPPPPSKTTPPTSPPKKVCPWNPKLPPGHPDCLKPKSDDPSDYTYPKDKPKVTKPTTPPETTPPPVVTEKPKPTRPKPTQPPEGGNDDGKQDNDGEVGGF